MKGLVISLVVFLLPITAESQCNGFIDNLTIGPVPDIVTVNPDGSTWTQHISGATIGTLTFSCPPLVDGTYSFNVGTYFIDRDLGVWSPGSTSYPSERFVLASKKIKNINGTMFWKDDGSQNLTHLATVGDDYQLEIAVNGVVIHDLTTNHYYGLSTNNTLTIAASPKTVWNHTP